MAREPAMHPAERGLPRPASSPGLLYPRSGRGVRVDLLEGHDDRLTEEAVLVLRGSEQFRECLSRLRGDAVQRLHRDIAHAAIA